MVSSAMPDFLPDFFAGSVPGKNSVLLPQVFP